MPSGTLACDKAGWQCDNHMQVLHRKPSTLYVPSSLLTPDRNTTKILLARNQSDMPRRLQCQKPKHIIDVKRRTQTQAHLSPFIPNGHYGSSSWPFVRRDSTHLKYCHVPPYTVLRLSTCPSNAGPVPGLVSILLLQLDPVRISPLQYFSIRIYAYNALNSYAQSTFIKLFYAALSLCPEASLMMSRPLPV